MTLDELVDRRMNDDLQLGYDVWQVTAWEVALSFRSDYSEEFDSFAVSEIENSVRTWRRENAQRFFKNAS